MTQNGLGEFLRDRRSKLDPASLGYPPSRRRTVGLRREEVAQRSHVSTTWYTWLEQGRGGVPSADVLDRLSRGLALSESEREHLFFLAQNRPPEVHYHEAPRVTPQLLRVLDALETAPACLRTSEWDVLAWNRAAAAVFGVSCLPPEGDRNLLLLLFGKEADPRFSAGGGGMARAVVAAFRAETARSGTGPRAKALIEELSQTSEEFRRLWLDRDVEISPEGVKSFELPTGSITLEYSIFAAGKSNLSLVVFNPATGEDRAAVLRLLESSLEPRSNPLA